MVTMENLLVVLMVISLVDFRCSIAVLTDCSLIFNTLDKAGLVNKIGRENVRNHINGALARAEEIVKSV